MPATRACRRVIRATLRRAIRLLVDDGWLAAAVIVWLVLSALLLPRLAHGLAGIVLFAGLAAILLESVLRRVGRSTAGSTG